MTNSSGLPMANSFLEASLESLRDTPFAYGIILFEAYGVPPNYPPLPSLLPFQSTKHSPFFGNPKHLNEIFPQADDKNGKTPTSTYLHYSSIMGIANYEDIIRSAENRNLNANKKNLKKLLNHPKNLQKQQKKLHPKKICGPTSKFTLENTEKSQQTF